MDESFFSSLSDDVVLKILFKLEDDPRNWARIACVSTKFSSLISTICFKSKCLQSIRAVARDLVPSTTSTDPPGGWSSLYKLSVCCPGLLNSGVLPNSNQLGPGEGPEEIRVSKLGKTEDSCDVDDSDGTWPFTDDLLLGDGSESMSKPDCKRQRVYRSHRAHLASGVWNLSREQGNKLLASRFKGDCLYICDWPGCMHVEEKRNYMLFRGVFKDFKESRVWRTIGDGSRNRVDLDCVFCGSGKIWDLHSSFCLRRYFGFHDDGDPVVRAYVCENGHVSGAWTDWPLYT